MPDIVIHNCTLRIVRRGGWRWGADPKRLTGVAVQALRVLLEQHLVGLWPESSDVEIVARVRVNLPVNLTDLKAVAGGQANDAQTEALGKTFRTAVAQAVAQVMRVPATSNACPLPVRDKRSLHQDKTTSEPHVKLMRLLVNWVRSGELEKILHSVDDNTIEVWHRTILTFLNKSSPNIVPSRLDSESQLGSGLRPDDPILPVDIVPTNMVAVDRPASRIDTLRVRIIAVVVAAITARLDSVTDAIAFAAGLDRRYPLSNALMSSTSVIAGAPPLSTPNEGPLHPGPDVQSVQPGTQVHSPDKQITVAPINGGVTRPGSDVQSTQPGPKVWPSNKQRPVVPVVVVRERSGKVTATGGSVSSVLPFLMLGSLSKIGYFEALDAMLSAADLSGDMALFATALAFKVLEAPERGCQRTLAASSDAAIFAGLAEPATNNAMAAFAQKASGFLPVLDRVIINALVQGHEKNAPLLLFAVPTGGWLLAEIDGMFPVAWSESWEGLIDTASRFGWPQLLVPAASADSSLFARLDGLGVSFLTDAPPTRFENWRHIHRHSHERWWTNDRHGPEGSLVASGRKLGSSVEAVAACWRVLATERLAVMSGDSRPLETSLAIAAAVALADLSWNLWKNAGETDPLLALERFGNLDARVQFGHDEIRVKLPLGKRSFDLSAHGLLGDVAAVPWFGGRVVRFSGGSPW